MYTYTISSVLHDPSWYRLYVLFSRVTFLGRDMRGHVLHLALQGFIELDLILVLANFFLENSTLPILGFFFKANIILWGPIKFLISL